MYKVYLERDKLENCEEIYLAQIAAIIELSTNDSMEIKTITDINGKKLSKMNHERLLGTTCKMTSGSLHNVTCT